MQACMNCAFHEAIDVYVGIGGLGHVTTQGLGKLFIG